jgi:hypothetical protein
VKKLLDRRLCRFYLTSTMYLYNIISCFAIVKNVHQYFVLLQYCVHVIENTHSFTLFIHSFILPTYITPYHTIPYHITYCTLLYCTAVSIHRFSRLLAFEHHSLFIVRRHHIISSSYHRHIEYSIFDGL